LDAAHLSLIGPNINGGNFENGRSLIDNPILWRSSDSDSSMHFIEANGHRLLLDCGMSQGRRQEANKLNSEKSFDAKGIDAIVLSHAHLDHSGSCPSWVKNWL